MMLNSRTLGQSIVLLCVLWGCSQNRNSPTPNKNTRPFFAKHESLRAYDDARDFGAPAPRKHSFWHKHQKSRAQNTSPNPSQAPESMANVPAGSLTAGMRDSEAIQRATMRPYRVGNKTYYPTKVDVGQTFDGYASWYGPNFHAKRTSNGETYNMYAHTAANKTLPMNTIVKVTNKDNNKSTIVRINDRGPFVANRIIDLSNVAARDIDMVGKGIAPVKLEVLGFGGVISKQYEKTLDKAPQASALKQEFKVGESQKSVSGGNFSLQMGAFRSQEGAQKAEENFKATLKKPYHVQIVSGSKDNQPIYRVFIKGFQSEAEANDFAKSIGKPAFLVRE
ncbi:septal ring lytic transglycosylase RlpA family protein [Helicobacter salomonis]|uniref:septal ring lytic transglycosylase RlpA family protein n=2 Tax=Helicobacter salomonis TaxID=56878 RepID=UPI001F43BC5E|nr:septal ring lytic transglycosylase RlpA family protein [Helicobacter salomonis]